MTTLAINFRAEDERFLDEAVKSGPYVTKSEVVASALELLKTLGDLRKIRRAIFRKEIQKGIDQLDRGETVEFTAGDIKRLGRDRLSSK